MRFPPDTKVYSYVRFSSEKQSKGDSVRRQMELSERWATKHHLAIDDVPEFQDLGVSAFVGAHAKPTHGLGQFLEAVRSGRVTAGSVLLVESFDRMSREDVLTALSRLSLLLEAGITIVTLTDEKIWSLEAVRNSLPDLIYSLIIMARANDESKMRSHRISASWEQKRRTVHLRKLTRMCPRWLRLTADGTRFEVIEERATTVRLIYDLAYQGIPMSWIARYLNEKGLRRWTSARVWTTASIAPILRSKAVCGVHQPRRWSIRGDPTPVGLPIPDYFPAIVERPIYDAIGHRRQTMPSRASVSQNRFHWIALSGILVCGYCGGRMWFSARSGTAAWMGCQNGYRKEGCFFIGWLFRRFEPFIFSFLSDQPLEAVHQALFQSLQASMLPLRQRKVTVEADIQQLTDIISNQRDPPFSLIQRLRQAEDALSEVSSSLALQQSRHDDLCNEAVPRLAHDIAALATTAAPQLPSARMRVREQIARYIEKIAVYPAGHALTDDRIYPRRPHFRHHGKEHRYVVIHYRSGESVQVSEEHLYRVEIQQGNRRSVGVSPSGLTWKDGRPWYGR